jgi:hypothetical protein
MPSTPYSRAFSASCYYLSMTETESEADYTYMNALDPLENQRSFPIISQEFQVLPVTKFPRITFLEPFDAKKDSFFRFRIPICKLLVDLHGIIWEFWMLVYWLGIVTSHKDRIGSPHLVSYPMGEGHVCSSEVVWSPSYRHRIKGNHQSRKPVLLCPAE